MTKPKKFIYVHFLDRYHANRAAKEYLQTRQRIYEEAHLALRMALLFADCVILPVSSFLESPLCKRVISNYDPFLRYGVFRICANDESLAAHLESKRPIYDAQSPEGLGTVYHQLPRGSVPSYLPKRSSSTARIREAWYQALHEGDPRNFLDPGGRLNLALGVERLWARIPDLLEGRAFIPDHVVNVFGAHGIILPPSPYLNSVIERPYIDGYTSDFEAAIITDLCALASLFEPRLARYGTEVSFKKLAHRLEGLSLLTQVKTCTPAELFTLRCRPEWDILAADLLRTTPLFKESLTIAADLRDRYFRARTRASATIVRPLQMTLMEPSHARRLVTIGIVTALPEEFVAMEELIDNRESDEEPGDPNRYVIGTLGDHNRNHQVALVQLARMANDSAASCATNLQRTFENIKLLVLCGIALGMPNPTRPDKHVRLGDIIVADRRGIIQFDHVVIKPEKTEPRSNLSPASAAATSALNELEQQALKGKRPWESHLRRLTKKFKHFSRPPESADELWDEAKQPIPHPADPRRERDPRMPLIFRGAIGSGNALIKDPHYRDRMRDEHDLLAIEMEGAGVAEVAWQFGTNYAVVRAACDYGSPKNDRWHGYAACAAAAYTKELIQRIKL